MLHFIRPTAVGFVASVACWMSGLAVAQTNEVASNGDAAKMLARLPIGFRLVEADAERQRGNSTAKSSAASSAAHAHSEKSGDDAEPSEGLRLAPRGKSHEKSAAPGSASSSRALATAISSLTVVAGLLGVVTWFARRFQTSSPGLPKEVFQYLGTTSLSGRQTIHVMRFGDKMLLVAATPTGLQTLAELTTADDVQRLTAMCRTKPSPSIASTLQRVVADWSRDGGPAPARGTGRATRASSGGPSRLGESSHA